MRQAAVENNGVHPLPGVVFSVPPAGSKPQFHLRPALSLQIAYLWL
jgi:hypothetical protein